MQTQAVKRFSASAIGHLDVLIELLFDCFLWQPELIGDVATLRMKQIARRLISSNGGQTIAVLIVKHFEDNEQIIQFGLRNGILDSG